MWRTDTIWFDSTVVFAVFTVASILFGHFEEHKPKWRRLLKVAIVVTVVGSLSVTVGRVWALSLLLLPLTGAAIIHLWWLPRHGVHGWTGEPKDRYYELIGHTKNK